MISSLQYPHWVDFCQSGPPSVLVKSDANDLPSRMQMSGQVQCRWVVRLSAITHPRGQPCGVEPIWKGSMRARIQPPSKTGVTGVTSVTLLTKRPVSLAFMPVTQSGDIAYLRCNLPLRVTLKSASGCCGQALCAQAYQANFAGSAFR